MLEMTLYIAMVLIMAVAESFWNENRVKRKIKKIFQKIKEKGETLWNGRQKP